MENQNITSWRTRQKIIGHQWNNPDLSYAKIAEACDTTPHVVYHTLDPLFKMGVLEKDGATYRPPISASE